MHKRTCSIEGCNREHHARGWCFTHWAAAKRAGEFTPDKQPGHRLSNIDAEARIADCEVCGPEVPIRGNAKPVCRAKARADDAKRRAKMRESPEKMARQAAAQRAHMWRKRAAAVGERSTLLSLGGGCCAICRSPLTVLSMKVDHDHSCCPPGDYCENCVRGILCNWCNSGLGFFRDNSSYLESAIEYLVQRNISTREGPYLRSA